MNRSRLRFLRHPCTRDLLIFIAFCGLTAVMTWPWVRTIVDSCADRGDPYVHSWIMWWDFHQTFHDPLHLFDGNIFYPLRYSLAFTENEYGIALLFFPLFALGVPPLTVNSIATLLGFAFSGYGAFRLTRTLTERNAAAWTAGIVFAFIPFRFHVISQITYVFAGWLPLMLESLILFARERSWKRAAWLGVSFTMNALSSLTWMTMALLPLVVSALVLITRYRLWRDRAFWLRGATVAAASLLVLLPFTLPYLHVSHAYGFSWGPEVVARNSPAPARWLAAESRNWLWRGFGDNISGNPVRMFTGLLAPLLAFCALIVPASAESPAGGLASAPERVVGGAQIKSLCRVLTAIAILAAILIVLSLGWAGSTAHPRLGKFFGGPTLQRSLWVFTIAFSARIALAYPRFIARITGAPNLFDHFSSLLTFVVSWFNDRAGRSKHRMNSIAVGVLCLVAIAIAIIALSQSDVLAVRESVLSGLFPNRWLDRLGLFLVLVIVAWLSYAYPAILRRATHAKNLPNHIRNSVRGEAFWLGSIWAIVGFLLSIGVNSWLYRVLFDLVFIFRSIREPARAAMIACLGLSVLAGIGVLSLQRLLAGRRRWAKMAPVVVALALLFELHASPMRVEHGAPYPDEVTRRLKNTPMKGGLVELPTGSAILPHLYMLRAADHEKPLINAISTFVPQHAWEIDSLSRSRPIPRTILDAIERVPTSYVVIHNSLIEPEQKVGYEVFLAAAVATNRLRFINRFDDGNDLYAVVKNEPDAISEAPMPFSLAAYELAALVRQDSVNLVTTAPARFQMLYRVYLVTNAALPRCAEFMKDADLVARGVILKTEDADLVFAENLSRFVESWPAFSRSFAALNDAQFVDRLLSNADLHVEEPERNALVADLESKRATRAEILLKVANDARLVARENDRSLLLLHYFAYLRRNPNDPPDRDFAGFNFWLQKLSEHHDPGEIATAFQNSIEFQAIRQRQR